MGMVRGSIWYPRASARASDSRGLRPLVLGGTGGWLAQLFLVDPVQFVDVQAVFGAICCVFHATKPIQGYKANAVGDLAGIATACPPMTTKSTSCFFSELIRPNGSPFSIDVPRAPFVDISLDEPSSTLGRSVQACERLLLRFDHCLETLTR